MPDPTQIPTGGESPHHGQKNRLPGPPDFPALLKGATPGPYFVSHDDKDPGKNYHAHISSGLAVIDTGRSEDWPVARFCEWPTARYLARLDPAVMAVVWEALLAANAPFADNTDAELKMGADHIFKMTADPAIIQKAKTQLAVRQAIRALNAQTNQGEGR